MKKKSNSKKQLDRERARRHARAMRIIKEEARKVADRIVGNFVSTQLGRN